MPHSLGSLVSRPSMPRSAPRFALPVGACDCHTHVFGPYDQFQLDPRRIYTPPEAPHTSLAMMLDALGIQRVIIVQPSVYGTDNAATLASVRLFGERARAVAVIDDRFGADALRELHVSGVRGVRINLLVNQEPVLGAAASIIRGTADRIASLGWHIQLFAPLGLTTALHQVLAKLPVRVVLDHFGWAQMPAPERADINTLCALVEGGNTYVKLSAAYRISERGVDDPAIARLARRLMEANPERILWGTDWPHPIAFGPKPAAPQFHDVDDCAALNALAQWADGEAMLSRILVDNPARLYGFE